MHDSQLTHSSATQGSPSTVQCLSGVTDTPVSPGAFDGVNILRYVHIYRDRASGGIEQQLRLLNRGLLRRHALTIIQTHLVHDGAPCSIEEERMENGRILWVPVHIRETHSAASDLPRRAGVLFKRSLESHRAAGCDFGKAVRSSLASLLNHGGGHLRYRIAFLSDHLGYLLQRYAVDLLVMHWMSYDSSRLIRRANVLEIPFALINHFENKRLSRPETVKWLFRASGIGCVSSQGLPQSLQQRSVNLGDAIDTGFFNMQIAGHYPSVDSRPIVLHPARIQIEKGHLDLIRAAQILKAQGMDFVVYFVGAVDSESLRCELQNQINSAGLTGDMIFLGEKAPAVMRDLFAASRVVVLPSHSEGLPRVLLEAQAMGKPVIAYNVGGISEAFLPNRSGYLVDVGDVSTFAQRIASLIDDEQSQLTFGREGLAYVKQQFGIEALVDRHERFYATCLTQRARHRESSA